MSYHFRTQKRSIPGRPCPSVMRFNMIHKVTKGNAPRRLSNPKTLFVGGTYRSPTAEEMSDDGVDQDATPGCLPTSPTQGWPHSLKTLPAKNVHWADELNGWEDDRNDEHEIPLFKPSELKDYDAEPATGDVPLPSPRRSSRLISKNDLSAHSTASSLLPQSATTTPTEALPAIFQLCPREKYPLSRPHITVADEKELDYLRSSRFDPLMLRVVPDMSRIWDSMIRAFGDSGRSLGSNRDTVLGSLRHDKLKDINDPIRKFEEAYKFPPGNDRGSKDKSRHLDIELFKFRVPHSMLLSFHLDTVTREAAIEIEKQVESLNSLDGPSKPLATSLNHWTVNGMGVPKATGKFAGGSVSNMRGGNRRRNDDHNTWITGADGQRKRRRESDGDAWVKSKVKAIENKKKLKQAVANGEIRYSTEVKIPPVLIWKILRVSAKVDVYPYTGCVTRGEREEEIQTVWWAVPEKMVAGLEFSPWDW